MSINILRYSLFGIAGGQEGDHNFCLMLLKYYDMFIYCILKIV